MAGVSYHVPMDSHLATYAAAHATALSVLIPDTVHPWSPGLKSEAASGFSKYYIVGKGSPPCSSLVIVHLQLSFSFITYIRAFKFAALTLPSLLFTVAPLGSCISFLHLHCLYSYCVSTPTKCKSSASHCNGMSSKLLFSYINTNMTTGLHISGALSCNKTVVGANSHWSLIHSFQTLYHDC